MSHLARLASALLLGAAFLAFPAGAQQSNSGTLELTAEQQRLLDMLPAGQRAVLLDQYRRRQTGQPAQTTATQDPESDAGAATTDEEVRADPRIIQPGDTLIVEVMRTLEDQFAEETAREPSPEPANLLLGRHTVQLDRYGQLTLPGLDDIPLAGLDSDQAAMRLMAEPPLADTVVMVTRLTLVPTGRDALEPFGYQIFRRTLDQTASTASLPVPGDYRVGPGDQVQVALFGKEFAHHVLTVTREGLLHVPNLEPVAVSGMRYSELKAMLETRIAQQTIGVKASVSMGELRAIEVFVLGDVTRPGVHSVNAMANVIHALYAAEGITEVGSLRDIRVLRDGATHARVDLYDLLLRGRPAGDLRLQAGDVVFVPATGPRAGVIGETLRPAWYELRGETTLAQLVGLAGGPGLEANPRRIRIERIDADGVPRFLDADLTRDAGRRLAVAGGDVVAIPRVAEMAENTIRLRGHFNLTGLREWRNGLRVGDVIPDTSALRRNPDLDYALVVRQRADGLGVDVRELQLREVFADPGSGANLRLEPRDEILTFGFDDPTGRRALIDPLVERLRRQATFGTGTQVVQVTGAVRAPGAYPVNSGMRVADLVRAGGGLSEAAFMDLAELTRTEVTDVDRRDVRHFEFDLGQALADDIAANLELVPHDILNVKHTPRWTERGQVELRGEVRFPGTYPIRPGELLSQVIERAGGMTEFAFPTASVFTRQSLREREQRQIDQMIQRLEADIATAMSRQLDSEGQQATAMARSLLSQLRATRAAGRLVINLNRLIANPGSGTYDVIARDGDLLVVPPRPQEVTVLGEVYFPTSHIHDPGLDRDDYLSRSGGLTYRADDKRIYIVRADGSVEAPRGGLGRRGNMEIRTGDTIVVPIDADRVPPMVRLMNISQIVYQLGIAAAAWNTLGVF